MHRTKLLQIASLLGALVVGGLACGKKGGDEPKPSPSPTTAPSPTASPATSPSPSASPAAGGFGTIHGKILFDGAAPEMKELPRFTADGKAKDANCATHEKANYVMVDAGGGVADVLVRLPVGAAPKAQPAAEPATIDQKNCLYAPHVTGVVEGSKVAFQNSDPTMHNIHPFLPDGEWFNQAQQPKDPPIVKDLEATAGQEVKVKCDAHPWMLAWVVVTDHNLFNVSGADGSFKIEKVPAGEYELEAWHPHMGKKTVKVKVEADKDVEVTFPKFAPADYKEPT